MSQANPIEPRAAVAPDVSAAAPPVRVNRTAFVVGGLVTLAGVILLFGYFGLASVPVGQTPQQAAGYFGARLIPFGLVLMVIGFAETLARAIGEVLYEPEHGAVRPRATIGLSSLAELLRAVTGLSASPAGIGALITLLGAFLLVGSGAAASTIP